MELKRGNRKRDVLYWLCFVLCSGSMIFVCVWLYGDGKHEHYKLQVNAFLHLAGFREVMNVTDYFLGVCVYL